MTAIDYTTYGGQLTDLRLAYVRERGREIREALGLRPRDPVGLSYSPGNGTVYRLVFVPVEGIGQLDDERVPVGVEHDRPEAHWVVVTKVNGTPSDFVYPFRLAPGHAAHCGYVEGHTGLGIADAAAVTALLRAVTGAPIEG